MLRTLLLPPLLVFVLLFVVSVMLKAVSAT